MVRPEPWQGRMRMLSCRDQSNSQTESVSNSTSPLFPIATFTGAFTAVSVCSAFCVVEFATDSDWLFDWSPAGKHPHPSLPRLWPDVCVDCSCWSTFCAVAFELPFVCSELAELV